MSVYIQGDVSKRLHGQRGGDVGKRLHQGCMQAFTYVENGI